MLKDLEQKVADFIRTERLLPPGQRVLLAVSGGADSTALLYVMAALKAEDVLPVDICCAHINHRLRGVESQRDEDFVVNQCRKLKLPVFTKQIDVRGYAGNHKLSIETAARKLRIDALIEIASRQHCGCIAMAHQKNDNAETILQRLVRGTGFRGLCGIWPAKEFTNSIRFVRPLLCVGRREIFEYLNEGKLEWCEDRTNLDSRYRRNFIRHKLLPAVQKDCRDDIADLLSGLAQAARGFYQVICRSADAIWHDVVTAEEQTVTLDSRKLSMHHPEVKIELIRRILFRLAAGEQDFTGQHYENLMTLSDGAKLQLPGAVEAYRQGTKIILARRVEKSVETSGSELVELKLQGKTEFAGVLIETEIFDYDDAKFSQFKANKNNTVEWFDSDNIKPPLVVRFRKPGDRFWPFGLKAEKKIGKFLTDEKIPQKTRQKLLVIADSEKIIWLCPVRISEQAKVTSQTKTVLQLKIKNRASH